MIVARICKPDGTPLVNVGSIRLSPYDGAGDGWFPIDSFNFGFVERQQEEDKGKAGGGGAPGGGKAAPQAPAPAGGKGGGAGGGKGKDKDFAELALEKQVDTASSSLMFLAMKERRSKKGTGRDQETKLECDIHVVSSISLEKAEAGRFTYTSLMIHLEAVNVQSWDIRGSGDSRPTESVKLRYDRAAMIYVGTADGKIFQIDRPKGWDQTANEKFDYDLSKVQKYLPPTNVSVLKRDIQS